jgi:environmental stress-induced protein Ves
MPMSPFPEVVRFADCAVQSWANGRGSTRVLAIDPDGMEDGVFDWRMSVATVDSGDFSKFPGVDRVIVLVDGPTMTMTIDGGVHVLDPFRPKRFAGESVVSCVVSQQCLDFNVMTRRGVCSADVSIRVGSGHVGTPLDCWSFIVSVAGSVTVRSARGHVECLHRFDTVLLSSAAEVCVGSGGRMALVRVKYAPGRGPR